MSKTQVVHDEEAEESLISSSEHQNISLNFNSYESGRTQFVQTKHGDIPVTICGNEKLSPMVTFSDMGLNFKTCYMNLLLATSHEPLLVKNFCFYHFQFPGIKDNERDKDIEVNSNLTFEMVGEMVAQAISKLELTEPMLMGVGVGGNIMLRVAARKRNSCAGLILVSPAVDKPKTYEHYSGNLISYYLRQYISGWPGTGLLEGQIVAHFVSRTISSSATLDNGWRSQEIFKLLRNQLTETLRARPQALKLYLDACLNRDSVVDLVKKINCRVLLISGHDSMYRDDSDTLSFNIKRGNLALVEFDKVSTLVTMQKPEVLASPLKLFFQGQQSYGFGLEWDLK